MGPVQRPAREETEYCWLERLPEREQRLAEAGALRGVGSWDWDLVTDRMTWSDQFDLLFGLESHSREGSSRSSFK